MKQHITQEQAMAIVPQYAAMLLPKVDITELMNAAIQHYLSEQAEDLPVLPEPEFFATDQTDRFNDVIYREGYTADQLQAYGQQCAAHAREVALEEMIVDFKRRAGCVSSKAGYSEGLRNGYLGAATAIEALKKAGK